MISAPLAFLLLFGFQGAGTGPRAAADPSLCTVTFVTGKLLFPPYVASSRFIDIKLEGFNPYAGSRETTTTAWDEFRFATVASGDYTIVLQPEGMDIVRQMLVLNRSDCGPGPGVRVDILLHVSPAIKPSPIAEDAVAIESLMRKIPGQAVKAFEKGMDKAAKTDPKEMSATLGEVLKTAPDYYEANLQLGLEYKKSERREDSIKALSHAVEVNSGSMLARAALGQYTFEAGDFQKAADLLSEASRLGSTSPDVYYMLGVCYYKLRQIDLAEASLLRALAITPSIGKAHLQLYNVYMTRRLPDKALKEAETYLEKYPDAKDRDYVQSMADKLRKSLKPQPNE